MKKVEMKPGQEYYYIVLRYMTWESDMFVKKGKVPRKTEEWKNTIDNLGNNFFLAEEYAENARAQIEDVFKSASLKVAQFLEDD